LLLDRGFEVGQIDHTLFTKRVNGELFVCQLYVDDIIFGSTNKSFNDDFSKLMTDRFEMSMMGKIKFFLGFEIKRLKEGTFINQAKYVQDMLKGFHLLWNTYYAGRIPHTLEPVGSFWWKDVCKLMPTFRGFAKSVVRDGLTTLFWKDEWLTWIVADEFPKAFSFASNEDVSVQQFLTA
jgi:hypothetical protein